MDLKRHWVLQADIHDSMMLFHYDTIVVIHYHQSVDEFLISFNLLDIFITDYKVVPSLRSYRQRANLSSSSRLGTDCSLVS